MRRALLTATAFCAIALPAVAQSALNVSNAQAVSTYVGPADAVTAPTACFSLRGCTGAFAGPSGNAAVQLRRQSDSALSNIAILSNGNLDITAAGAFAGPDGGTGVCTASTSGSSTTLTVSVCTASATLHAGDELFCGSCTGPVFISALGTFTGTGAGAAGTVTLNAAQNITAQSVTSQVALFVARWYDQTRGNKCAAASCDLVQATTANQLYFLTKCLGTSATLPCITIPATGTPSLASAAFTPVSGVVSMVQLAMRPAGVGAVTLLRENTPGNRLSTPAGANSWLLTGGTSGSITATASDSALHAGVAVVNGASSAFYIDNTSTTGTVTGNTAAGAMTVSTTTSLAYHAEVMIYDGVALSSGQVGTLHTNQSAYWNTP